MHLEYDTNNTSVNYMIIVIKLYIGETKKAFFLSAGDVGGSQHYNHL